MDVQDLLTYLIDAIALSFIGIATLDFVVGLMPRKQVPSVSPGQLSIFDFVPEQFTLLPDPWTLPDQGRPHMLQPQQAAYPQPKLLLLPQAKDISNQSSSLPVTSSSVMGIDFDTLRLRPARKIAKMLGISQKVNGTCSHYPGCECKSKPSCSRRRNYRQQWRRQYENY